MKKRHRWYWIIILLISVVPLIDLFHPGLPVTHDGQDHVARIANFYQNLSEGHIVPRWAGNLNWGYGHPVMMFLYPLPSYAAALFHAVGFSLVDSTKLIFALGFLASVAAMFWWVSAAWGEDAGVVSAVLYGFAPYRFVDLYVRGAIGEHVAFVFLPIICWGLLKLSREEVGVPALAATIVGSAGLILSHNAVSLMFFPLVFFYALYLWFFEAKKRRMFVAWSVGGIALGFLLSAFFWIPAFFEGKYTLRDIVTVGDFRSRFVPWSWFIWSPWNYGGGNEFTKTLGAAQLLGAVILAGALPSLRKGTRVVSVFLLVALLMSLALMTQISLPVWEKVTLMQKFQFPWRFLTLSVALSALIAAQLMSLVPQPLRKAALTMIILVAVSFTYPMWHAQSYKAYPESFFTGVYHGTTDTGESSPIWSVRFMEQEAKAPMEAIDGYANITVVTRTSTYHTYDVEVFRGSHVVENTLYFPGWQVVVDGRPTAIEFQNPAYRGLMTFVLPKGQHRVEVVFGETKLRLLADWISAGALVLLVAILGTMRLWRKRIYR